MLDYFRKTVPRQFALLLGATCLAIALSYFTSTEPRIRFSADILLRCLLGATLVLLLLAFFHFLLLLVSGKRHEQEIELLSAERKSSGRLAALGAGISLIISQELVLRGYVFSAILLVSPLAAYLLNAALSAALHFRGRKFLGIAFLKALEGTMYALMYASSRSLAMVLCVHLLVDTSIHYLLSNPKKPWISYALSIRKHRLTS